MIAFLAGCGADTCEIDGGRCRLESASIERVARSETVFDDRDSVTIEMHGELDRDPFCVLLAGTADPGVSEFTVVEVGEVSVTGDPGAVIGWVYTPTCPSGSYGEPVWRVVAGTAGLDGDRMFTELAIGRLSDGALRGVVSGCAPVER